MYYSLDDSEIQKIHKTSQQAESGRRWFLSLFDRHSLEPAGASNDLPFPETMVEYTNEPDEYCDIVSLLA